MTCECREKIRFRRNESHIAANRLDDDGGDILPCALKILSTECESLNLAIKVSRANLGGTPGLSEAQSRDARTGLYQQAVGMPVIAAVEFDYFSVR